MDNHLSQTDLAIADEPVDIGLCISSAMAIADLIFFVAGGGTADGSDSRLDELHHSTIPAAMWSIQEYMRIAEKQLLGVKHG